MKVGVIGAGGMGRVHGSKYAQMPDVELLIWEPDQEKREGYAKSYSARPTESFEALLDEADAIDICIPTDFHHPVGLQALKAGKPTMIEKPLARTVQECRELIAASEESGALLVPAHVVRFFKEFRSAHELIWMGKIGSPASVRVRRGGKAPAGTGGWFQDHTRSGGVILDLAIHEIDWLLWTLGPATQVYARSVAMGRRVEGAEFVGDYALITISHASGCVSHIESTWLDPSGSRVTLEAAGSNGMIELDSRKLPHITAYLPGQPALYEWNRTPDDDPYYKQLRAFVLASTGAAEAAVTAQEAMAAVELAEAAIKSAQTSEPVFLN